MREYRQYLLACFVIAFRGSVQSASNWAGVVGFGSVGIGLWYFGVKFPAPEWPWDFVVALSYFFVAWVVIFLFRLIFVAPYQLYRKYWRPPALEQLNKFYVEIGPLIERSLPKDDPAAIDAHVKNTSQWVNNTAKWIGDNLGGPAKERFLDRTGMLAGEYLGAASAQHSAVISNLTRYRRNLRDLIEKDVWR